LLFTFKHVSLYLFYLPLPVIATTSTQTGIRIILDFVPNHTSDQHDWFIKSEAREPGFEDFYVWHDGRPDPNGGERNLPPNNWVSVFYGSAWTWSEKRGQFYLHQFTRQQPDLNFRNTEVLRRMNDILNFWLTRGVAGFRVDAINHMFEAADWRDEPVQSDGDPDPLSYGHLLHYYTKDLVSRRVKATKLLNNLALQTARSV